MKTSKLRIASLLVGILVVLSVFAVPAIAANRRLIVTLLGGKQVAVTVDAPEGAPAGSVKLPDFGLPVTGVSEVASVASPATVPAPAATSTSTSTSTATIPSTATGAAPSSSGTVTGTTTQTATGPAAIGGIVRSNGKAKGEGSVVAVPEAKPATGAAAQGAVNDSATTTTAAPQGQAQPTTSTPGFTIAPTGPAPLGVPNFFIEQFRIPPFLLPIYQAAGIQYSVPWQVLAAINEIETDYGRNLSVSSAGALGWMQFMPSSWDMYGVDANGDGVKDPFNPADAIFAAARYLKAAGADTDLAKAIFAYNHADWYVQSVLLRARVIGGMPADLVGSLTGLTEGHFPIAARATYAGGLDAKAATKRVKGSNAAVPVVGDPARRAINIFSKRGAPVIAVNDGRVVKLGTNARLGRFIVLQDVYGNRYTYAHLGSIARRYPVPKPNNAASAAATAKELELPKRDAKPTVAATAGAHRPSGHSKAKAKAKRHARVAAASASAPARPAAKERLFAHPARPDAYRAGGKRQLDAAGEAISSFDGYFTEALQLDPRNYVLEPLRAGSTVIAGTILGRVGKVDHQLAPHVEFSVRPSGRGAPIVDPKPILDGWKLLESTAIYRASGQSPFFGQGAKTASVGQILLMSKEELQQRVLADPNVTLYACGRDDVAAGQVDRRVLATIEFLVANGLDPTISALKCGHSYYTTSGNVSEHSSGDAVDIAAINGISILGHQGADSITDLTIRRLLTLQGAMKPHQIISLMTYPGTDNTLSLPDHANHIHVGFHPLDGSGGLGGAKLQTILKPSQWTKLVERLSAIPNPTVATSPSKYAIKDGRGD